MQEIIVYRNPVEAAMWNMIMDHGLEIVIFTVICLSIIVGTNTLIDKYLRRKFVKGTRNYNRNRDDKIRNYALKISIVVGTLAGCFAIAFLKGVV